MSLFCTFFLKKEHVLLLSFKHFKVKEIIIKTESNTGNLGRDEQGNELELWEDV